MVIIITLSIIQTFLCKFNKHAGVMQYTKNPYNHILKLYFSQDDKVNFKRDFSKYFGYSALFHQMSKGTIAQQEKHTFFL